MSDTPTPPADRVVSERKLANATMVALHDIMANGQEVVSPTGEIVRVSPNPKYFDVVSTFLGRMGYQHNPTDSKDVLAEVVDGLAKKPKPALPAGEDAPFDMPEPAVPAAIPMQQARIK